MSGLAFSKRSPNLLAGVGNGAQLVLTLWDWQEGTSLARMSLGADPVLQLCFNPYTGMLVAAGRGGISFFALETAETPGQQMMTHREWDSERQRHTGTRGDAENIKSQKERDEKERENSDRQTETERGGRRTTDDGQKDRRERVE